MPIDSQVEVKQVRLIKGTGAQIAAARQAQEILETDLVVQTDSPDLVPTTRTVNGHPLSSNVLLDASDIGAATSAQGDLADTAVQPSTLNNYVTLNTLQTITSGKKIFANDVVMAGNQAALLATISNNNTYTTDSAWVGRYICGAKNLTFLMGTFRTMAALGAHSWSNAQTGSGDAWADFYLNPDGDAAVYIGGYSWTKNSGLMKIKNNGNTSGTVQVNRGSISSSSWKNVACWDDNVSKFNNDAGYITASYVNNPTITITQGGTTKGSFTLNQSSGATIALDAGGGTDDWGQSLQGDVVLNNTFICAPQKCYVNQRITSFSAPNATEADLNNCFSLCENLQSFSTPNLETIGPNGLTSCCSGCSSLTSVASFDKLKTLKRSAMFSFASGCILLEDVYFPALTTSSFVDATNQFSNFWNNTGTTKTHTMHFPSNLQTTIQGLSGYPNFGGTSGYVVLAFDLPQTE